jgi:predicted ester cyclase
LSSGERLPARAAVVRVDPSRTSGGGRLSAEENKAVVLRFIDEVFVQHDSSNIEELVANESLRQIAPGTVQAFPDLEMTVEQVIAEGDVVAVRVSAAATHKGDFRGIAPTGKRWEATASAWYEVQDGKISDFWVNWDWLAIMEAIGAVERVEPSR